MIKKNLIFCFLFLGLILSSQAQNDSVRIDSGKVVPKNSKAVYSKAKRATLMSAILPGLGQVYNKKYWKVPIIYAGIGGFGYMFYTNNIQYTYYRDALLYSVAHDGYARADGRDYSTDQLLSLKQQRKKYRDFGIIGVGIFYLLNIVDANVDGHLATFDVSDDLSINVDPWQTMTTGGKCATGLSLKLNFK